MSRHHLGHPFRRHALGLAGFLALASLATPAFADKPRKGQPADAPKQDFNPAYFQGTRVLIDGSFQDWYEAEKVKAETLVAGEYEYDWTDPTDLTAQAAVQYNDTHFFVYVDVDDNAFKAPDGRLGADTVDLWFDLGDLVPKKSRFRQLRIDPTWAIGEQALEVKWRSPKSMKRNDTSAIEAKATLREKGYTVEVAIPFDSLSPIPPTMDPMGFCVVVNDWDHDDKREEQASVATCPFDFRKAKAHRGEDMGQVKFEGRAGIWRGIARELPEAEKELPFKAQADVGGDKRREEVAIVGDRLVVLGYGLGPGEWYAYKLGMGPQDKVIGLELRDVTGNGQSEILVTQQRGYNVVGAYVLQDLVTVFGFIDNEGISDPLVAIETRNASEDGDSYVANTLAFSKGKITQKLGKTAGWKKDSYPDADGGFHDDYQPLLTPWSKPKSRTHKVSR